MNTYKKIQKAMRDNEKWVIKLIKKEGYYKPIVPTISTYNALDRLEAAGKIKYSHKESGYILTRKN